MPTPDDDRTGARIREQRKLARLTQKELAQRIPYSLSLINAVECGSRAASADLIATVARALHIDVTVLTGQPYVTELQQDRLAALVRPIREALDLYDLGPDPDQATRPAHALVAGADNLCKQVRATHLRNAAQTLPGAITELTTAAWQAQTTELWQALASTYRTAHDIAVKLGYYDLASVALDRMAWAAERASDPCLSAVRQYMRALVYFREGEYRIGQRLIAAGVATVDQAPRTLEAAAVRGQIHLGGSVLAARARQHTTLGDHLAAATDIAKEIGDASSVHWLSFGPANVAMHRMSAAVELRQYDEALTQARAVRLPTSTATSRRAHFLIDRARAEMETGRTDAALKHLVEARRAAPEQTRYHPGARETISGLIHIARRTPDTLSQMAVWVGL